MKAKKRRGVEVPPKIQAFINSVTNIPLESIAIPLVRFAWEYEKGDFYHWVELMNHFDSYFEKYVKSRKELQLDGEFSQVSPFPKDAVLQILKVTRIILDNCVNKHCYSSCEHLSSLLASTDTEILIASLQTLAAFVKKSAQSNRAARWHGDQTLNLRLFSLAQGWGVKEEGLGLVACAMEGGCDENAIKLGSNLHFEFYLDTSQGPENECMDYRIAGLKVIQKELQNECRNDLDLLQELINEYKVPENLRFSLWTRLRFAKAFSNINTRRKYLCIQLLAFTILLQSNPDADDLSAFFSNEPEFVNELVFLLHCEDTVPEDVRMLAILALAAQAQDRPRQTSVLGAISAGGNRGIIPTLVQKAVGCLNGTTNDYSVPFVEALLFLITVLVSTSGGCAALRESGLIPTLLPFLKDTNPSHTHLVASGVHILEAFMDYSSPAATLFRDLGGLEDAVRRLQVEVNHVEECLHKDQEISKCLDKGKSPMVDNMDGKSVGNSQSENITTFQSMLLLKALLRAISLGTYAPGNATRIHSSEENSLALSMCTIFRHAKEFGGGVFSLAASLMSDLIHKDPTCFQTLDSAGLPAAFLESITNYVLPSSEAVSCIPHSLDALCLNNAGLQAVKDRNTLNCFVKIFTSKLYLRALTNETPTLLASGLDELMRHAPSLRGDGVDVCIEILRTIASIGGLTECELDHSSGENDVPVPMEAELEVFEPQSEANATDNGQQESAAATETETESSESCLLEYIHNVARLLEALLHNADTSRIFVEKKGVEAILNLFSLPNLPLSFGGSSVAHSMSAAFRAFSPSHAVPLCRAVCSALRKILTSTIESLNVLSGAKLCDMEFSGKNKLIRYISSAELYLSLSSVLVRSSNTTMTELSAGGVDVLYDLGKVYREVIWQISMYDDAKAELKKDEVVNDATHGSTSRDGEDDSTIAPVHYVNPVSIRDGSGSHWDTDSDIFPLIPPPGFHRRARREQGVVADIFSQRLRRLARHNPTQASHLDVEGPSNGEGIQQLDGSNIKSPDSIDYEVLMRFASAARGLYISLGKAMIVPSRRRDDVAAPGSAAKEVSTAIAKIFYENMSCNGFSSSQSEMARCRYLRRLVDDIQLIVFDSRRHTCNTLLINKFYAYDAIGQLLRTFQHVNNMAWSVAQHSDVPMDGKMAKSDSNDIESPFQTKSCLFETLQSYAKLVEHLVTPTLLLSPQPMAQMLVQQVPGSVIAVPREPEMFVRRLQSQVLDYVLPVWNHPFFPKCNVTYITSVASILTHIYTGVNNLNDQRNADANILGPPPDESSVLMIVEMGFSRERAEEALRRVVTNSVEMAMEWLFSHPEEPQEDDELARALTLSLGNADAPDSENSKGKETVDEIILKTPPVEDILDTCIALFQNTDAVAFPLVDLLVTLCNHSKGQDRVRVVTYLINRLKLCSVGDFLVDSGMLSVTSNLLALLLNEDWMSREVASVQGLVSITLGILSTFDPQSAITTPKWVTALLLVLDLFSQNKTKTRQDQHGSAVGGSLDQHSLLEAGDMVTDGAKELGVDTFVKVLSKYTGYMALNEQHHAMEIACKFLSADTPATTVQAVLQLCARLTKVHSVAIQFLESGGLAAILNLPRRSLFPGFDSVAAVIIRHLLEDPQTLQQAMESEIRHTLTTASHRHNGRVAPRMFLTTLAPVILRNPAIFMQASVAVCHIENFNGQPHIVLSKDKEKEKDRDKDKDEKDQGKSKSLLVGEAARSPSDGSLKSQDPALKSKCHKKVPQSFAQVIDQLLEVVLHSPVPVSHALENEISNNDKGKTKLEENMVHCQQNLSERSAGLAKVAFILKLMMEILLMYSGAVGVVLRRDSEACQGKMANSDAFGHGGLLYHILHRLLPYSSEKESEKLTEDEWREKLSDKAAYFLLAVCIRSAEGRRRIISEISKALLLLSSNIQKGTEKKLQAPNRKIRTFIFLINLILSAHQSNNAQAPALSSDMAKAMIDAGLVQVLTNTLEVIDLDHPEAVKLVNAVLKALEALTRAASTGNTVYNTSGSIEKEAEEMTPIEGSDAGVSEHHDFGAPYLHERHLTEVQMADSNRPQVVQNHDMVPSVNSDSMINEEQPSSEAQIFMHQPSLNPSNEERETVAAELTLRVERRQENVQADEENDDDDDEMEGDDGEEEEEDEDEMEGTEGVTHLSPPDTDIEDHDDPGLSDNYPDDYIVDDGDEEDWQDWHENQVIEVRWRDSLARFNHGQIQILGHGASAPLSDFAGDPFQSMNEIFSSFRRPTVLERWRLGSGSRLTTDRSGGDRTGGAFQHPLLSRQPISNAGAGSTPVWRTAGSAANNANGLRGIGFDAPFYMYDHVLSDNSGNRLLGDRGVGGGLLPPLLDFSMDHGYLTGRRGTRSDNRLSTWTDDGQPQAGAYAAALAQSIEEQYVCHLRNSIPEETEQTPAIESVPEQANDVANMENAESDTMDERTHITPNADVSIQPATEGQTCVQLETCAIQTNVEVENQGINAISANIISMDMHMDDSNNLDALSAGGREVDTLVYMEEQGNSERAAEPGNVEVHASVISQNEMHAEDSAVVNVQGNSGGREPVQAEQNDAVVQPEEYQDMTTIDPTFLEALPEYLRAEVLASHENQAGRAANVAPPSLPTEDIDPEFLAALPPDIQAEVLAQQRAQRLMQSQQAEGQPVDMDSASIIATFPVELREEVLLTSSDQVLAGLPPSLLAEAQLIRERAMNQYQTRGPFTGARFQRNNPIGGLDRAVGSVGGLSTPRRSNVVAGVSTKREVEGKPLVDASGLKSMLQLLYLAQPLGKGLLQRLLLNLCAHSATRACIVKLLLEMLNPGGQPSSTDSEMSRLYGCRWNVVYARAQVSDGVPPLVSRRVLEILTHLSKHQGTGADLLTYMKLPENMSTSEEKQKGKSKVVDESCSNFFNGEVPLVLLLKLLNQPLYSRSSAHLEQLMVLLEVIVDHISTKYEIKNTSKKVPNAGNGIEVNISNANALGTSRQEGSLQEVQTSQYESSSQREVNLNEQSEDPSTSATEQVINISDIVTVLPEAELRKLCRLLAQEGLFDVAYSRVAEVIKKLAHVASIHRRLLKEELEDAAQGLTCPAITELNRLGSSETMTLSSSSMVGAAILRILQCLNSITSEGNENADTEFFEHEEVSTTWKLKTALEPLWQALSSCILRLENCLGNSSAGAVIAANASGGNGVVSPLPPETHRVLPFVEAFFVLSEKLRESSVVTHVEPSIATAREIKEAGSSSVSFQMRTDGDMAFLKFSEKHRRMLNAFLRQNHALLEKSFALLLKAPRLIDFDNKRAYFRARIRQQHEQQHYSPLRICVRRPYVLEDSYNQLRMRTVEELKGRLTVQFQGEEGIDAGGLTREWYQLLSRVIFDKGALLFTTVGNESTFQPNPNSVYQTEHLSYFKFVGRVVAKALFDGQLLDVYFTRSFYKHILGVKVTYHDIEAVDPDYYKNLKWMLENDISDVVGVFFSVDADEEKHILYEKAEVTDVELIPGGRNIRVTEENKHEYVDLNAEHKLTTAIRPQINAFLEGFNELVNRDLISIFNDKELELLISGLPEIDLDDLKANTEYTGYTAASPVVQWFWEVVRDFNKEDMARLLQFITGTSKVPLEGFKALQGISGSQRCQIHKAYGAPERLPTAHTCFNQLDLPEYSSKEQLQERLLLAIHEASEGFGFG